MKTGDPSSAAAWRLLVGDELHYGVFDRVDEPLGQATAALTRLLLDAAKPAPGLEVLQVGDGAGTQACQLALERGAHLTTVGAAVNTGLPDASFDCIWAVESLHLLDGDDLIAECARLLRPGGRLVVCDLVRHREPAPAETGRRREEFEVLRAAFGWTPVATLAGHVERMTAAGLQVLIAEDLTSLTLPTFAHWRENAHAHYEEVALGLGIRGVASFLRSCDILESLWRDGTFGYGLVVACKSG
jgi:27-O-demethylrifamycin SV methyltransferase